MDKPFDNTSFDETVASRRTLAKGAAAGGLAALFGAVASGRVLARQGVDDDTTGDDTVDDSTGDDGVDDTTGDDGADDDTTGDDDQAGSGQATKGKSGKRKRNRRRGRKRH